jgi:hypothetical protein
VYIYIIKQNKGASMKIRIQASMNAEETKIVVRFGFSPDDRAYYSPDQQFAEFKKIYAKAYEIGFEDGKYELTAEIEATEEAAKPFQSYAAEIGTEIILM